MDSVICNVLKCDASFINIIKTYDSMTKSYNVQNEFNKDSLMFAEKLSLYSVR